MPFSHHSHSGQFCKHASGTLEQVVQAAILQKFVVFGLTEHVPRYRIQDLYPEEKTLSLDDLGTQFDDFLVEAARLKALYADQIDILIGLETEYITAQDLDRLATLSSRVEYVVGSIHHVNGVPIDFDLPTFETALQAFASAESFLCAYFEAQYELIRHVKPEVIGHFDLCRLYTPALRFADYPEVLKLVERNVKEAVEYGALFEVNASAFRKKWDTAYPGRDVLDIIIKLGGRLTLSDDSHGPAMVGLNYDRVATYLRSVEVSEIWFLRGSQVPNAAGRFVQTVQLEGDWSTHPFWQESHPST